MSAISGIRINDCFPRRIDLRDRLEIDFGLSRAGDAIEQRDVKAAVRSQRPHRIHGGALLTGKFRLANDGSGAGGASARGIGFRHQRAFVDEAIDNADADAGFLRGVRLAVQQAVRQQFDQPPPRRRQARGGSPTSRTPIRTRSGPRCSPIRNVMRSTMPRADSV